MPRQRVVLHVDMDAFYAAIEVRENPALAGKPLIIGHRGARGVVSTCSYEARPYGVRSAMPSVQAEKLCPQAIWLPGRMSLYVQVSADIRQLFDEVAPAVEPLSIDEAWLDLTGIAADLDAGCDIARNLKHRIHATQSLTASVGIAPNKFLAKIASDLEKPDGLVALPAEAVAARLWPLPVERLWGVGPKTAARLHRARIRRIGDLVTVPARTLERLVGARAAEHLQELARGDDERPVQTDREARSMSEERTYSTDLFAADAIDCAILERADGVASQLRHASLVGRTVHLKVRNGDFETWTRAHSLTEPTDLTEVIVQAARALFRDRIQLRGKGVRLLGVGMSGLEPAGSRQATLFPDAEQERARRLAQATDAIRQRLGEHSLVRARLLQPKQSGGAEPSPEASSLPSVD